MIRKSIAIKLSLVAILASTFLLPSTGSAQIARQCVRVVEEANYLRDIDNLTIYCTGNCPRMELIIELENGGTRTVAVPCPRVTRGPGAGDINPNPNPIPRQDVGGNGTPIFIIPGFEFNPPATCCREQYTCINPVTGAADFIIGTPGSQYTQCRAHPSCVPIPCMAGN
jgi:hypothetical protein